ncbi:hypothetical protein M2401_001396 [Pseudomonas sp. JUb42]|jgi:hypothetical protein|uniref:hypothetical protein n=1 Tax=Pseudomonas sp. JUb42 TaxID=2940611 RepID=UPI002169B145|nr:hypothetical protein [Pseudomonas sp. JUb42]MCS3467671.1 hypothetical protein [Pseudomonas sp. JUb42]
MHKFKLHPPVRHTSLCDQAQNCLTINIPNSTLGLDNLLDLVRHEIIHEQQKHIHRLTFKSGRTLHIEADQQWVTVRGAHINYRTPADMPSATLLGDPAQPVTPVPL